MFSAPHSLANRSERDPDGPLSSMAAVSRMLLRRSVLTSGGERRNDNIIALPGSSTQSVSTLIIVNNTNNVQQAPPAVAVENNNNNENNIINPPAARVFDQSNRPLPADHRDGLCASCVESDERFPYAQPNRLSLFIRRLNEAVQDVAHQRCPYCILNRARSLINRIQSVYFEPLVRGQILGAISGARGFVRLALGVDGYRMAGMMPNLNQGRDPHGPFRYSDPFFDMYDPLPTHGGQEGQGGRVIARARRSKPVSRFGRQPEVMVIPPTAQDPSLRPPAPGQKRGYETAEFRDKKAAGPRNTGFWEQMAAKRARFMQNRREFDMAPLEAALNSAAKNLPETSSASAVKEPESRIKRSDSNTSGNASAVPSVPVAASSSAANNGSAIGHNTVTRPSRTLWFPEMPPSVNVLANSKFIEPAPGKIRTELGYHNRDAFLDISIQQERALLNTLLLKSKTTKGGKVDQPDFNIVLICANALENIRVTDNEHYYDWLGYPPVTEVSVSERYFGSCTVHQFVVSYNLADAQSLFELVNRVNEAVTGSIDLVVVAGGFPGLTQHQGRGEGFSRFPDAVQWSVIIANALVSLREGLAANQLLYLGVDVRIVDTAFRTFRLRGAMEQLRHRNLGLFTSHRVYVSDVLSHSESLNELDCTAWTRQRLRLMLQLILRAVRNQLFSTNL